MATRFTAALVLLVVGAAMGWVTPKSVRRCGIRQREALRAATKLGYTAWATAITTAAPHVVATPNRQDLGKIGAIRSLLVTKPKDYH